MTKTLDLVAIGEPLIEFNQRGAGARDYLFGYGGDTSNCVIAASRLGARAAYISRVGDDGFGRALMALWASEGVQTQGVTIQPGAATGLYFVSHGPQGHEFEYRRAGSAASQMDSRDVPESLVAAAKWLHCSGISQAISTSACDAVLQAVALARKNGTLVSYDLNFRPRLWPAPRALALARQTLQDCELFFPSVDEVELLTGLTDPADIVKWSHDAGAKTVILKLGARGCLVSTGPELTRLPAMAVQAVDATGAGDCFAGACLRWLAAGSDAVQAARHANVAAALSTRGFGAVDPLPRRAEVEACIKAQGVEPDRRS